MIVYVAEEWCEDFYAFMRHGIFSSAESAMASLEECLGKLKWDEFSEGMWEGEGLNWDGEEAIIAKVFTVPVKDE